MFSERMMRSRMWILGGIIMNMFCSFFFVKSNYIVRHLISFFFNSLLLRFTKHSFFRFLIFVSFLWLKKSKKKRNCNIFSHSFSFACYTLFFISLRHKVPVYLSRKINFELLTLFIKNEISKNIWGIYFEVHFNKMFVEF